MTMTPDQIRKHRKQQEESQKNLGGTPFLKIEADEEALIRIGPPWKKDGEFWKDRFLHGNFDNSIFCAQNDVDKKTGKRRRCAVCKRFEEMKGDRSKLGKKLWVLLRQRSEGLWNAAKVSKYKKEEGKYIVRNYEGNQFKILRLAPTWHGQLLDIFGDDDLREKSLLGVADPKVGRLIKVSRRGKKMETEYSFRVVTTESPIFEDRNNRKKMESTVINLDKLVRGSSDEEIEAFLHKVDHLAKKMVREDEKRNHSGSNSKSGSSGSGSASHPSDSSFSSASAKASSSPSGSSSSSGEGSVESRYREMKEQSAHKHSRRDSSSES